MELLEFRSNAGSFNSPLAASGLLAKAAPIKIWTCCFAKTKLFFLASKILSLPVTSAECERNFSLRALVHNKVTSLIKTLCCNN